METGIEKEYLECLQDLYENNLLPHLSECIDSTLIIIDTDELDSEQVLEKALFELSNAFRTKF